VPWELLAAIASVESGFGANMATSSAGAIGYGQFLPSSWDAFGEGGDPYDYRDAIPAMARYLVAAGVATDIPNAVWAYNHSWEYVALVLGRASYYAAAGLVPTPTPEPEQLTPIEVAS
jgi:membrane-bound lytic murein transglycosylase B